MDGQARGGGEARAQAPEEISKVGDDVRVYFDDPGLARRRIVQNLVGANGGRGHGGVVRAAGGAGDSTFLRGGGGGCSGARAGGLGRPVTLKIGGQALLPIGGEPLSLRTDLDPGLQCRRRSGHEEIELSLGVPPIGDAVEKNPRVRRWNRGHLGYSLKGV